MCGVVGLLAFDNAASKEEEKLRQESMIYLGSELLEQTQTRGKDATGVAALFDNCDYMLQKMGIPAQEFLARFGTTEKDFEGFLKIWRRKKHPARVFMGQWTVRQSSGWFTNCLTTAKSRSLKNCCSKSVKDYTEPIAA